MQTRRTIIARGIGAATALAAGACASAAAQDETAWTPAWVTPTGDVRDLGRRARARHIFTGAVRLEAGGERLRVRLSNRYGAHAFALRAVEVRSAPTEANPNPPAQSLMFAGESGVVLDGGQIGLSDPITMSFRDGEIIEVRIYVADSGPIESAALSSHINVVESTERAPSRAQPAEPGWPPTLMPLLEAVEVAGAEDRRVVVCFGDSITSISYPTELSALLAQQQPGHWVVINQGIGGNRVLRGSPWGWRGMFGPPGAERFRRMIEDYAHIDQIVLVQGTNDIALPGTAAPANETVTDTQIIAGLNDMITTAKARGIRVIGGTLLPFGGYPAGQPRLTDFAERERARQVVNAWVRERAPFDQIVDFDALLRDPAEPSRLPAEFDSGDHVHPNPQGFARLAAAVSDAVVNAP